MANTSTNITVGGRLSFAHLFAPAEDLSGRMKYSCSIIIPKTDKAAIAKVEAAIKIALQDGISKKWGGVKPANLYNPLRDGDKDKPNDPAYANAYFINAKSDRRPGVVDRKKVAIMDPDAVYSGCYCNFGINFYAFGGKGANGVACGLNAVQFVRDGEPLSGGMTADQAFDVLDDDNFMDINVDDDLPFEI